MHDPIQHDDPRLQAVDAELMSRLAEDLQQDSESVAPSVAELEAAEFDSIDTSILQSLTDQMTSAMAGVAPAGFDIPASAMPTSAASMPGASAMSLPTTTAGLRELLQGQIPAIPSVSESTPSVSQDPMAGHASMVDAFDVMTIRKDFPILHQEIHGKPLIWLDNAATTQKPQPVIDAISNYYQRDNSNVHRGAHTLATRSTEAYESARQKVAQFIGASSPEEIVFVRGTTEGINLIANTFGKQNITEGDEIVLSTIEHHANIVPWQMLANEVGAVLRVAPITNSGEFNLEEFTRLLGPNTKLVAVSQVSNALGTILPVQQIAELAHRFDAAVLVDGAQSIPHMPINVQQMDADFFVFSGHKLFAPTGVGAVYAKKELLEQMPPWQGGGNMIEHVTFERTTYAGVPQKFEAGTATLADAVGLGAAIDYLNNIGMDRIASYESQLTRYGSERLQEVTGLRLIGTAPEKASVLSFVIDGTRPEDVARQLDGEGIAVRAGHHCAQPTMERYGLTGTVRPSLAFYNTHGEIDTLVDALKRLIKQ